VSLISETNSSSSYSNLSYQPSADTRIIYVSNQEGDDATATIVSPADVTNPFDPNIAIRPYKTLSAAVAQLRDGFPDWILLQRGDTWTNQSFGQVFRPSGRSASEPLLLAYYGSTGDRPLIKTGPLSGLRSRNNTSYITIVGLELYSHTRDPNSPDFINSDDSSNNSNAAFYFLGSGDSIVIEDTVMRFFATNLLVQSDDGIYSNFVLRRSMLLDSYTYHILGHSQGSYISSVDGILIEDNLFDHNGWNEDIIEAEKSKFNHHLYMQNNSTGTIIVRNNIFARSSSGIQGRPGGLYENNLLFQNAVNMWISNGRDYTRSATARNNVVLQAELMDPYNIYTNATDAVWGMDINSVGDAISVIEGNIVANAGATGSNMGIQQVSRHTYASNIVSNWHESEDMNDPTWSNPDVSVGDYMASLGLTPTPEALLENMRSRKLGEWDVRFAVPTINDHIRAGFNR